MGSTLGAGRRIRDLQRFYQRLARCRAPSAVRIVASPLEVCAYRGESYNVQDPVVSYLCGRDPGFLIVGPGVGAARLDERRLHGKLRFHVTGRHLAPRWVVRLYNPGEQQQVDSAD